MVSTSSTPVAAWSLSRSCPSADTEAAKAQAKATCRRDACPSSTWDQS
jgi:hypothetical protein